jgi:hypothetical protein
MAYNNTPFHGKLARTEKDDVAMDFTDGRQINSTLDMADISRQGQHWKEVIPGQAGGSGSANGFFIGGDTLFHDFLENVSGQKYFLLELFNYDPDQDQTGDHFTMWVKFDSFGVNAPLGDAVKESIAFTIFCKPSFTANV